MNSESPFRTSSMVLTVACIICGIAAASYLVPRFIPLRNSVEQTKVAASALQVNLSEFHPDEGEVNSVAASHQPLVASRRPLLPASNPPATASGSATLLKTPTAIQQTDRRSESMSSSHDTVQTTSVQRNASPWASEGHSVPQFYAPVTVHPVTVNIDNAGIIREISRVHERLDSLSAEARSAARSGATLHEAAATAPVHNTDAPATESSSQYKVHNEQTKQTSARHQPETDHPLVTAIESQPAPKPKPVPTRLPTTPPQLASLSPVAEVTFEVPTDPQLVTPPSIPVSDPAPTVAVTPPPVPVAAPEPLPERFEMTPRQPVPEIPTLEPPAFEPPNFEPPALKPEPELPGSLPATEFSTEFFPVPEPTGALEATPETEESLLSIPVSDFVEPMAYIAPAIPVQQPVWPDVATLADPQSPSAKRTTDPPFMNGRSERVSAPQTQIANEPTGAVQRVSHTTQAADKHTTPCNCKNCAATRQPKNPAYRIRAVTPSQTLNRIRSALSF
ncbi:MAG: hypothetical protein H7Z17_12880 [Fuerstia sp.]|nr:hypothetical protein [Fuerstiella sp.]